MSQFDMEMTYRMCSQVPLHYFVDRYASLSTAGLLQRPVPFESKIDGLAMVSTNCQVEGAFSGRTRILRETMALADRRNASVKVMSYGKCLNNRPGGVGDKVGKIAAHKFCVAMENSITQDYVTEKLWDALTAGCVPVYIGAPNVDDFLPDPDAIIHYGRGGVQTPEDLLREMERLAGDREAYEKKLAWKRKKSIEEFPPSFQAFLRRTELYLPHVQCQLCEKIASHRVRPRKFTTCLWNQTWMHHAGRMVPGT